MLTSYSTTLIADGKDNTLFRITVIDKDGKEITSSTNYKYFNQMLMNFNK